MRVERDERDAEVLGLLLRADRGRDRDDVLELAGLELLSDALYGKVRSRTGPEPDDHPALDVIVDGLVPHLLLEFVLGHRYFRR